MFLEQQAAFGWHTDTLTEGARLQVSFLKDLVTLRDPTSRFSFLNYLKERGRLEEFANLRTFHPTRREFNDYFSWAADILSYMTSYGARVLSVRPVEDHGAIHALDVSFQNDLARTCHVVRTSTLSSPPAGARGSRVSRKKAGECFTPPIC
jgi:L-ornithine N5-oxygenase